MRASLIHFFLCIMGHETLSQNSPWRKSGHLHKILYAHQEYSGCSIKATFSPCMRITGDWMISYPQKIQPALSLPMVNQDLDYFNLVPSVFPIQPSCVWPYRLLAWKINILSGWVQHLLGDGARSPCLPCLVESTSVLAAPGASARRDGISTNNDKVVFNYCY